MLSVLQGVQKVTMVRTVASAVYIPMEVFYPDCVVCITGCPEGYYGQNCGQRCICTNGGVLS